MSQPARRRHWLLVTFRVLLAIAILVWVLARLDLHAVGRVLRGMPVSALLLSFVLMAVSVFAAGLRWRVLLRTFAGSAPPLMRLMRDLLVGLFVNLLPGGVAGDALRAVRVRENAGGVRPSLYVIWAERLAGLAGLLMVFFWARSAAGASRLPLPRLVPWVAAAAIAAIVATLAAPRALRAFPSIRAKMRSAPLLRHLEPFVPADVRLWGAAGALALSLATQAAICASIVVLVRGASSATDALAAAEVSTGVVLAVFVPVTPGAVGQRELAFTEMFARIGVERERALACAVAWFALALVFSAVGAVLWLCETRRPP